MRIFCRSALAGALFAQVFSALGLHGWRNAACCVFLGVGIWLLISSAALVERARR